MTAVSGQSAAAVSGQESLRRVVFAWELPEGTGGLGAGAVLLEVTLDGEDFWASLVAGERRTELATRVPGVVEWDAERGMWHAGAPDVLIATWREGGDGVLYARSPLIEKLGLVGGTYEFRGMLPGEPGRTGPGF